MNLTDELFLQQDIAYWGVADMQGYPLRQIKKMPDFAPTRAICALLPYYTDAAEGNLSYYARGEDYHTVFLRRLEAIAAELRRQEPTLHTACYADNSPVDEVYVAVMSGLGKRGMNHLLLHPVLGSYCFIGVILCDAEDLEPSKPTEQEVCLHCGACVAACPTGALRAEECGALTFRRELCLSEVTQRRGELTEAEERAIGENGTAWGCDRCQQACPLNRKPPLTTVPEWRKTTICSLHEEDLAGLSNREFLQRYGGMAFAWRGKAVLLRNLRILKQYKNF